MKQSLLVYNPSQVELVIGRDVTCDPNDYGEGATFAVLGSRLGGIDVRPKPPCFPTLADAVWYAALRADGWRWQAPQYGEAIVVDCETLMTVGRNPFVRTVPTDDHPRVGAWRCDDDNGTAVRVADLRVYQVTTTGGSFVAWTSRATLQPTTRARPYVWVRLADGGRIEDALVDSGRYADRLPTNRKRKRERCKAYRRARFAGRALQTC